MFLEEGIQGQSRQVVTAWQNAKLSQLIERVYEKNLFYRAQMELNGLAPDDIQDVVQLQRFPLMGLQEVKREFPYGLLTVPTSSLSHISMSHDATMCYSRHDMEVWYEVYGRMLTAAGVNMTTVFQLAIPEEEFRKHLVVHEGARRIGAMLVPADLKDAKVQIRLMQDFGVTAVYAKPRPLLALAEAMNHQETSPYQLPLRIIFCSMEDLDESMRSQLQLAYGVKVNALYGLNSILGMDIAGECQFPDGLHLQEDCIFAEIVDPATGEVLPEGQAGELVITTLVLEAMPLVRYRTGMHARLDQTPCACGQTFLRIKKI